MKLNLAYPEKSGIMNVKFNISKFPDGQQSIIINQVFNETDTIEIYSRLNNFKDLELIICANKALRNLGVNKIKLYVPYFLGARSDRKFTEGGVNYLKEVICPIVNSQKFKSVTVLDPHSDVLEACINNFKKIDNIKLVKEALTCINNKKDARENLYLVSPDAGALKKIYHVAEHFQIDNIVIANKHRDIKTGKIISTEVPGLTQEPGSKNFVIVDDICDGGRTFLEIAKAIRRERNKSTFNDKIYLVVTHGIFSAGLNELNKHFDVIFCTNSISDIYDDDYMIQINIF